MMYRLQQLQQGTPQIKLYSIHDKKILTRTSRRKTLSRKTNKQKTTSDWSYGDMEKTTRMVQRK